MNALYEAHLPRQLYGYKRSDVKLLVFSDLSISKSRLNDISNYLSPGDILVFNNSKIVPSSLEIYSEDFQRFATLNIGTDRRGRQFLVEVRPKEFGSMVNYSTSFSILGTGYNVNLIKRHETFPRFWWAELDTEESSIDLILKDFGKYIRYDHIPFSLPDEYFDGIFYKMPGSVELPSASYSFDSKVVESIKDKGVSIAELTLHCNLGSVEYPEFKGERRLLPEKFSIPLGTLRAIHDARSRGRKVIAVGTTVVRALESLALDKSQQTNLVTVSSPPGSEGSITGTTEIYIDGSHTPLLVDAIITGMHEKDGSHIRMLEAFQPKERLNEAYKMAECWRFQYHEFGDIALIFSQSRKDK
jgi:S-adenosylmethionine:tRNA ribosyltransferase-isomerase